MTNFELKTNTEHNGIELYFEKRPNAETITELKKHYFKWHNVKKCWFAKDTPTNRDFCELLSNGEPITETRTERTNATRIVLNSLKVANTETVADFVAEQWNTDRMQKFLLNTFNFYITEDNYILEIEKANKLTISKTLYYNDELDAPQINFANFKDYNSRNCNDFNHYSELIKNRGCKIYFCVGGGRKVYTTCLKDWELEEHGKDFYSILRVATETETQDLLQIMKQQQDQYFDRLQKYYNKYKENISTFGYWANR